MAINFDMTKVECVLIRRIVDRAHRDTQIGNHQDRLSTVMDLAAINNAIGLDLWRFLYAPPIDFVRDIFGIRGNLDRSTGSMGRFMPRFARDRHT